MPVIYDGGLTEGSVIFVRPRLPEYRHQGWHPHGCWPAVVQRIDDRGKWVYVQPCGPETEGQTVALDTERDTIAAEPCETCTATWTAAGWQKLARTKVTT